MSSGIGEHTLIPEAQPQDKPHEYSGENLGSQNKEEPSRGLQGAMALSWLVAPDTWQGKCHAVVLQRTGEGNSQMM